MGILVRSGTIQARSSARCAVCGEDGVHVGATTFYGAPQFYHWRCLMLQAAPATELIWASERDAAHGNLAAQAQGATVV